MSNPLKKAPKNRNSSRFGRLRFEPLEQRMLLDADSLLIGEFMAANGETLADGHGAYEDWIEIHNPTGTAVELDGWCLTDDSADLTKWRFPPRTLAAGEYLVVFASGRDEADHVDPDGNPHTNFKLDADGDSLALVAPDGTIADAYWHYSEQFADVSYGLAVDTLVASGAAAEVFVPTDGSLATIWTSLDFTPEVAWAERPTGVGYDVSTGAGPSTPLKIDLGRSINSGPTQSGWESIEHDGTSPATRSFPHDELAGPGNSVVVTVSGQTHWRDYAPATGIFAPLSNLLSDGPLANAPATISLDLENLLGGTYEITTYHHTTQFGPSVRPPATPFDVYLTDGLVTDEPIAAGAEMSDNNSSELRTETFQFTVVDGSPVRIAFDRGPSKGQGDHFALPGFELRLLREARVGDFVTTDLETEMHGHGTSAYLRTVFEAERADDVKRLALRIKYDDGFAAYLNGTPIAARNAPPQPTFNATATRENPVEQAVRFEEIDVSAFLGALQTGANVLAVHGLNLSAANDDFLILPELIATGAGESAYMTTPTPGESNAPGYSGLVADTRFSVDRGFYTEPFDVAITTETPDAQIRYTLDGSRPTETTGTPYTEPITIDGLTTLRAAAFKPDHVPTNVDTHTYVFLDDVVVQDGAGFPAGWGIGADYAMENDPGDLALIAGDSGYTVEQARQVVADALLALPTLSIVLDTDDVFGSARGIYANTEGRGFAWERPTSVELIYADGTPSFQQDAGIRIQGFTSRNPGRNPKHSLRLVFRNRYGAGQLDYPFFGDAATGRFDTIVLRSNSQDAWVYNTGSNRLGTFARDQWLHETQTAMGRPAVAANYVHLYINGLYWGVYNPSERPDGSFAAACFGGDKEDYDALKNHEEVLDGNGDAYFALLGLIQNDPNNFNAGYRDLSADAAYRDVLQYVDAENLADYMIHNMYAAAIDWPGNNYVVRNRVTGEGFKFFDWDGEHAFKPSVSTDRTGPHGRDHDSPTKFHHALSSNAEYRLLFADRLHRAFSEGGALYVNPEHPQWDPAHPEWNVPAARWRAIAERIDRALIAESARWGDYARDFYGVGQLYTPHDQLLTVRDDLLNNWFPQRSQIVFDQFRARGMVSPIDAPLLQINGVPQHGGTILPGDLLEITAAQGTAYYTLDGSDPRLPGGAINLASAVPYTDPIVLQQSTPVLARVLAGGQWSALNEATYHTPVPPPLVVTEINYHPHAATPDERTAGFNAAEQFEFIELRNVGPDPIGLNTVRFVDGVEFDFAVSEVSSLEPSEYVVVVRDRPAFEFRYGPGANVAGQFSGGLKDSGERIQLAHGADVTFLDFRFDDADGWPGRADGKGAALEVLDTQGDYTAADNWHSSVRFGGTPGAEPAAATGIVVNEVLSHTDLPQIDAIELHNTTDAEIDVGGWYLSDTWGWESDPANGDYRKFRIPEETKISAGGYAVFYEGHDDNGVLRFDPATEFGGPGSKDFALSGARGDDVWLMEADAGGNLTRFADHVEFGAALAGESFGRWPGATDDLYPMIEPTLGQQNGGPRLGSVVISEVMYGPAEGGDEFIEIFNPADAAVPLFDPLHPANTWRFGGVGFEFPPYADLPPGGVMLVVAVDPDVFRSKHDVPAGVSVFGPYNGALDNAGDRLRLLRPDEPTLDSPPVVPRVLVDQVEYEPDGLWPEEADGGGKSLHRLATDSWGNAAASWTAAEPTPGVVPFAATPKVTGRYVFYNNSVFDENDDAAIAGDKTALRPGDTAKFANYTSYSLGINGIIVDVAHPTGQIDAADFAFQVGNGNDPGTWAEAPKPASVTLRPDEGTGGSDRVTIAWDDYAIRNQWLQVTVFSGGNTGLATNDVFYFGNAVGEAGNSTSNTRVTTTDLLLARNNPRNFLNPARIDFSYDYNRDKRVNATDVLLARNNQTNFLTALKLIDLQDEGPGRQAAEAQAAGETAGWLHEYDPFGTIVRPSKRPDSAAEAVDKLLLEYWP